MTFKNCLFFVPLIFFLNCGGNDQKYVEYVDPFIGTGFHGHTYPGATVPFGMVQLSPDTRNLGWDACSGYHYSDNSIAGFSHTHLSGTGCGDYGDILLMPTVDNDKKIEGEDADPDSGFRSRFSKVNEQATPGYYSVKLDDYNIFAELTTTTRVGFHRYTFPKSDNAEIIIDLTHMTQRDQENKDLQIKIVDEYTVQGLKKSGNWAPEQYLYFYAKFSKAIESVTINNETGITDMQGKDIKAFLKFKTEENEQVLVKVGISAVSVEGAKLNLEAELPGWDFDATRAAAEQKWEKQLGKIQIEDKDCDKLHTFYTALYHSSLAPNTYMDIDGKFRGYDRKVHQSDDFTNYTVFSLWDTYRALHPLFTIIEQERSIDLIKSLLSAYETGGSLPKWGLAGNYTGTMIGYHSVSVIIDAYLKGITDFDIDLAYEAIMHASDYDTVGVMAYNQAFMDVLIPKGKYYNRELGFVPADLENESVSKALEYAYDDWCIAQLAKKLGKTDDYRKYIDRSQRYRLYFDKNVGFMRGKNADGSWVEDFNPKFSNHRRDQYTEGNAWQWTWYVPHDVDGLIGLFGGRDKFTTKLDSLFIVDSEVEGANSSPDISGLIGQYAQGNEPSHHIPYLYNYAGQSWKTQMIVDSILTTLYTDKPDGLCGNEDCGQMSAWYVMSAMGIYAVAPGEQRYSIGRPLFDKVTLNLENGKQFTILSDNNSPENKYIQSVDLNGKKLSEPFISHGDIMKGGKLHFVMGDEPNYQLFE